MPRAILLVDDAERLGTSMWVCGETNETILPVDTPFNVWNTKMLRKDGNLFYVENSSQPNDTMSTEWTYTTSSVDAGSTSIAASADGVETTLGSSEAPQIPVSDQQKSLNTKSIVGASVGATFGAVLLASLIVIIWRRRNRVFIVPRVAWSRPKEKAPQEMDASDDPTFQIAPSELDTTEAGTSPTELDPQETRPVSQVTTIISDQSSSPVSHALRHSRLLTSPITEMVDEQDDLDDGEK